MASPEPAHPEEHPLRDTKRYTQDFDEVYAAERRHMGRSDTAAHDLVGLAISGGGIRSASFATGIVQAMVNAGSLSRVDYLSTVSGGGYLGSALTWFLAAGPDKRSPRQKGVLEAPYGVDPNNFPLGAARTGARRSHEQCTTNAALDYIRQHGNYLTPGGGLDLTSFLAVVLRSMLVSLAVYLPGLTALLTALVALFAFEPGWQGLNAVAWGSIAAFLLFACGSVAYGALTSFSTGEGATYRLRTWTQKAFGWLLEIGLACALFALLPVVYRLIGDLWTTVMTGTTSLGIGTFMSVLELRKQQAQDGKAEPPGRWRVALMASSLLFGFALLAFTAAMAIQAHTGPTAAIWGWAGGILAWSFALGSAANLNYVSPHRMYRDRLMETFMPDPEAVANNRWRMAIRADAAGIEDMCQAPRERPYHLINTNIVLVDSEVAKYRGRGGDSFLLSPLYCGSNATGWRRSDDYMHAGGRGMTLATAMAISGAALNPNAGVAGQGATRTRLVSSLLSLLNLRLGYWAPHPQRSGKVLVRPNLVHPGLTGGVLRGGLHERRSMIELSDGGHFENLAVYELIRRQVGTIICCDGGADPEFRFDDLANLTERVRVDFGVKISFDADFPLAEVRPGSDADARSQLGDEKLARRGFAVGKISYGEGLPEGRLLYVKATLVRDLPPDVLGYKAAHPAFPDESTGDQFFDEVQFEAYRELGYYLGWQMLEVWPERAST